MTSKKAIIVTGTPAAGKTTAAKMIAEHINGTYIDVNIIIEEKNLSEGYDNEMDCKIIDTDKLNLSLIEMIDNSQKTLVIDSHMSHYIPKEHVSLCIVINCELKELKKRLEERGYSTAKVKENMDAEIFDICRTEAEEAGHRIITLTSSGTLSIAEQIGGINF